jgi:hypothetical protein
MDNDGVVDYDSGPIDRDIDNDGIWEDLRGGVDREINPESIWSYKRERIKRALQRVNRSFTPDQDKQKE